MGVSIFNKSKQTQFFVSIKLKNARKFLIILNNYIYFNHSLSEE